VNRIIESRSEESEATLVQARAESSHLDVINYCFHFIILLCSYFFSTFAAGATACTYCLASLCQILLRLHKLVCGQMQGDTRAGEVGEEMLDSKRESLLDPWQSRQRMQDTDTQCLNVRIVVGLRRGKIGKRLNNGQRL
jgi:hypothetical protein